MPKPSRRAFSATYPKKTTVTCSPGTSSDRQPQPVARRGDDRHGLGHVRDFFDSGAGADRRQTSRRRVTRLPQPTTAPRGWPATRTEVENGAVGSAQQTGGRELVLICRRQMNKKESWPFDS